MTMVVTIASKEANAGKSILGANLSLYLNQKGHRTGLIVAGARQPVWGIEPNSHWPEILEGHLPLEKVIHRNVFGIDLLVARNCGRTLQELCARNGSPFDHAVDKLGAYAYLIVDCAAQISPTPLACCLAASAILLVLTPDTTTLTANYEWLAHLARHDFQGPVNIIFQEVENPAQARSIYLRFRDQARNRLKLQTSFWGSLNKEPGLDPQVIGRYPLSRAMPQSELLRNIHAIGDRLEAEHPSENPARPPKAFCRSFIDYLRQLSADPTIFQRKPPPVFESQTPMKKFHRPETGNARALAWLNTQLTNIAHDLQAIRRLLETGPAPGTPPGGKEDPAPSHRTTLDFDAFVGRNQKPEE